MKTCETCKANKVCDHNRFGFENCGNYITVDAVPRVEVAELLRVMFADDCACNYNGNDEWLPQKCKYAETDCPMPKERLGCWVEFVEHSLANLKKQYTEENK